MQDEIDFPVRNRIRFIHKRALDRHVNNAVVSLSKDLQRNNSIISGREVFRVDIDRKNNAICRGRVYGRKWVTLRIKDVIKKAEKFILCPIMAYMMHYKVQY